jgi:ubiquitin carboxyl-terminal hydrolase 7
MKNYVRGIYVDFESSRIEKYDGTCAFSVTPSNQRPFTRVIFSVIPLDTLGFENLLESFRKFVAEDILDEYHSSEHGKQPAIRGISFVSFPPVLHIRLTRSVYDPIRDRMTKVSLSIPRLSFKYSSMCLGIARWPT